VITVALADDQELVRAGFRMILDVEDGIEVVGEAGDGRAAIRLARERQPGVLLMDIRMPVLDGIEATREIVRLGGPTRVLILTTFDHDKYLYEAMRAGAAGFIVKDASRDQLIHAIRVIAQGDALLAPNLVRRLVEDFCHRPPPGPEPPAALSGLTERELDVLRHVARGLTNTEIAATLFISEATVKTHLAHAMTKLGLRDRVQAVVLAYETGLRRPGDTSR
jgi:DNA-binding NarL/FixJ family response regulator